MTATPMPTTYLAERIADTEREMAWLEGQYAELREGTLPWSAWDEGLRVSPGMTDADCQHIAKTECAMALDAARAHLEELRQQAGTAAMERSGNGD